MYNIVNQLIEFKKTSFVNEEGINHVEPTHLLLTEDHYTQIMKGIGINHLNMPTRIPELYGLKVIYTDKPIEEPRVLYINEKGA